MIKGRGPGFGIAEIGARAFVQKESHHFDIAAKRGVVKSRATGAIAQIDAGALVDEKFDDILVPFECGVMQVRVGIPSVNDEEFHDLVIATQDRLAQRLVRLHRLDAHG